MIHDQTKKIVWDGNEHEHLEKTTDWYWGLGIVIVTGIVIAIISKNYLFAILLLMGGIMLGAYANDKNEPVHVEISDHGVKLNNNFYTYDTIISFWIYENHKGHNCLAIVTGRKIMPQRIITFPETISAIEIRGQLIKFIKEKEVKPNTLDIIADSFGL